MPDTYAADDYGSISQHLKALEDARRQTAAEPQISLTKWGVWFVGAFPCWLCHLGLNNWHSAGPHNPALSPTLYATKAEAHAAINAEDERFKTLCQIREYPE